MTIQINYKNKNLKKSTTNLVFFIDEIVNLYKLLSIDKVIIKDTQSLLISIIVFSFIFKCYCL